jgi:hypothetical protein
MKCYVVTIHKVDTHRRWGAVLGVPMVFHTWIDAMNYGRKNVNYTRTDFRVVETVVG